MARGVVWRVAERAGRVAVRACLEATRRALENMVMVSCEGGMCVLICVGRKWWW